MIFAFIGVAETTRRDGFPSALPGSLRGHAYDRPIARLDPERQELAKTALLRLIARTPAEEVPRLPLELLARELPEVVADVLEAAAGPTVGGVRHFEHRIGTKTAEPPSTREELLRRAEAMAAEGSAFALLRVAPAPDASFAASVDATRRALRPGDATARVDGDLCILAPGLTAEGGLELARRVADAVEGVAGVAVFPDHPGDPEDLLTLADEALFAAKAANEPAALPPSATRSGRS